MREEQIAAIRAMIDALNAGHDENEQFVRGLLARAPEEWDAWLSEHPEAANVTALRWLIDEAESQEDRDPQLGLALTQFVLRHIDEVTVPPELRMMAPLLFLRGDTWRVHASMLRYAGDLSGALHAYETAAALFRTDPLALPEIAAAECAAAYTRHQLGESGEPQRIIRARMQVFSDHNDAADLVRALMFDGAIDFDHRRYDAARATFERALPLAESLDNVTMITALHNNLGHCAQLLGDREAAAHHLTRALHLYERHGMTAAVPRALWGLAELAADEGFIDAAVAAMESIRGQLLASGMPLEAAVAQLDMVELLILANETGRFPALASDLVATFTAAGMKREALQALAFVQETARAGRLTTDVVGTARRIVTELRQTMSS